MYSTGQKKPNRERVTGTQMERCGNAKISVELERVLNKNAFYRERDNAFHWELMARVETVMSIENLWLV